MFKKAKTVLYLVLAAVEEGDNEATVEPLCTHLTDKKICKATVHQAPINTR